MTETIHPKWEALTDEGKVAATWTEKPGSYQTPEWIRKCRDMYYPGHPLRVTRMIPVSHMDGEGEPGILVLPPEVAHTRLPYPDGHNHPTFISCSESTPRCPRFGEPRPPGDHPDAGLVELCPGVGYGISERPHPRCLTPLDFHPAHGVEPVGSHPDAASSREGLEDLESP